MWRPSLARLPVVGWSGEAVPPCHGAQAAARTAGGRGANLRVRAEELREVGERSRELEREVESVGECWRRQ